VTIGKIPGSAPLGQPWTPEEALVVDVRRALAHAPRRTPEDRFEAWAWRALLDEDGPALLTRHAAPSHVTASGVVLSADASATCLVLHGRMGLWVQPGGHLEPGDLTMAGAAVREVLEETGLTGTAGPDPVALSRHRAPCRPDAVDWHLDVQYLVLVDEQSGPTVSPESLDVAWWPVHALPADRAPGLEQSVSRAVEALARSGR
jgi:8-oxo-dGTP pyrophosphatase MutT (NUDIX family)